MLALAIPLIFLTAIAAVVGPVVYRGTRAYQKVFEEPVPRDPQPFVAVRNDEGTPVPVLATTTAVPEIPEWNGTNRLTMLLLGVDRREDEPSRSDTMILVNIDPVTKTAGMVAIPRDLRVIIPGYGVHKINAAYAFGESDQLQGRGPGLVISTIETNFGVHVDYFAEVDFTGFVKIVDTLGGVTLDVPYPIKDNAYPASGTNYMRIYFPAGWQHLDGERALQYARTRHDDGDGSRSIRQQQVLLALRAQAVGFDLLPKAGELLGELSDAVRTDLGPTQALQLARLATEFSPAAITSYTLDPALTEDDGPDGYYLDADWEIVGGILSDFTGTEVTPPMSALANPRRDIAIRIENGTLTSGLGERVATVLEDGGFSNVAVIDRTDAGAYPASSITTNQDDLSTAFLVAGLAGVNAQGVTVRAANAPAGGDSADVDGLVIVLGDDAPDPAYFLAEPFTDEPPIENTDSSGDGIVDAGTTGTDGTIDEGSADSESVDEAPVDDSSFDQGAADDVTTSDGTFDESGG